MKRRQSLRLLGLLPAWLAACKDKFPSAPTVVTGKVVDENGLPVKGVKFTLDGNKRKGITLIPTFREESVSDEDGVYSLSSVVSKSTDVVFLNVFDGTLNIDYKYDPGVYMPVASEIIIRQKDYGETITINFQIKKR